MELSLKKYLFSGLKFSISFFAVMLSCIAVSFIDGIDSTIFCAITIPISAMLLLLPALYYWAAFFRFGRKCKNFTPTEGIVFNWETGPLRYTGSVIVRVGDTEYSSSAYFTHDECKELVGKTVYYAIIDELLFIYGIKQ